MAEYTVNEGEKGIRDKTLSADTVDTVTFDRLGPLVEVLTDGAAPIYFTTDGTEPTVGGNSTHVLPAAPGRVGVNVAGPDHIVKLVSPGAPTYSVSRTTESGWTIFPPSQAAIDASIAALPSPLQFDRRLMAAGDIRPTTGVAWGNVFALRGARIVAPISGTLTGLWLPITGTATGTLRGYVFDTGQAASGQRTLLWEGADVLPGAYSAQAPAYLGNPNLPVVRGRAYHFAAQCSDTGTTFGIRGTLVHAGHATLPAAFDENGLSGVTGWWSIAPSAMGLGAGVTVMPTPTPVTNIPLPYGIVT